MLQTEVDGVAEDMKDSSEVVDVVCAIIREGRHVLIVQRAQVDQGAGDWEFPGGKVEENESPEAALIREIEEELSLQVEVISFIAENTHQYASKKIKLRAYWCRIVAGELKLNEHLDFRWLIPSEIKIEDLSPADRPFVDLIMNTSVL